MMKCNDLLTEGLRNDLCYEIQNLRKQLELTVSDRISLYVELTTDTNWFVSFFSPNLFYSLREEREVWMTNPEFLYTECLLNNLIVSINGNYYNGLSPLHDPKAEQDSKSGVFLKEVTIPFQENNFNHNVVVKIFQLS